MIFVTEDDLNGNGSTSLIPLAMATTCSLNLNVDSFDATSKDSGSWQASLPGMKSWTMSSDNLYCPDYDSILSLAINRTQVTLYWIPSENTEADNSVTHTPELTVDGNTYMYYYGTAWINSVSASAANNEAANYNVSFTGTGALSSSDTLPSIGIGVNTKVVSMAAGGTATVVVTNYTGTLTATSSDTDITASISNGVVTITADDSTTDGAYHVAVTDSGTNTTAYIHITVVS